MTPQIPPPSALRVGYSASTKASITAAACLAWLFTWSILAMDAAPVVVLPAALAVISTILMYVAFRSGFMIDESGLTHSTWRGRSLFPRSEFVSAESMADGPDKTGLLLRFQSGFVLLSASKGCANPASVRDYLERYWGVGAGSRREPAGPVDQAVELEYEPLHPALLAFATVALAFISSMGPMFWAAAIVAFFTGRAFYTISTCRRITADANGLTVSRPFQSDLTMPWSTITSVRYWHSLAHGGIVLSDGTRTLRIYRWIRNYPRFNRAVQDHVPATSFAGQRTLPWTISLNRKRKSSLLVLLITAGVSLWLADQGAWGAGALLFLVPAVTFIFTVIASDRHIEIGPERIRLVEKKSFRRIEHDYSRTDLEDMRLGRQLTAGGLWLNFGAERLEIANLDSESAPEEILAVLRREWQTSSPATAPYRAA